MIFLRKLSLYFMTASASVKYGVILLFAVFHFFSSWALIWLFEPNAEFVDKDTFFWFYIVSTTTIGYGDFSPTELGSRIVTVLYMFPFGLILVGYIIGILAGLSTNYTSNRRSGMSQLKLNNHIVVFGEDDSRCVSMISNLISDTDLSVCLVSEHKENPMPDRVNYFVSGDVLDPLVRKRCCLKDAGLVMIYSNNDNQTIGEALTALEHTKEDCRIIVYFENHESSKRFNRQSHERINCVHSVDMGVFTQEALDPGSSKYITDLVDNQAEGTIMCYTVAIDGATSVSYADAACELIMAGITPLGLYEGDTVNILTSPDDVVMQGARIAVAAKDRKDLEGFIINS